MEANKTPEQIDESTLHEVFRPTEQVLGFIVQAANVLAEKYNRHPADFSVVLGIKPDGSLSGDNHIGYTGPEPIPVPSAGDTVAVGDHVESVDDHGDSETIRLVIPRSF